MNIHISLDINDWTSAKILWAEEGREKEKECVREREKERERENRRRRKKREITIFYCAYVIYLPALDSPFQPILESPP